MVWLDRAPLPSPRATFYAFQGASFAKLASVLKPRPLQMRGWPRSTLQMDRASGRVDQCRLVVRMPHPFLNCPQRGTSRCNARSKSVLEVMEANRLKLGSGGSCLEAPALSGSLFGVRERRTPWAGPSHLPDPTRFTTRLQRPHGRARRRRPRVTISQRSQRATRSSLGWVDAWASERPGLFDTKAIRSGEKTAARRRRWTRPGTAGSLRRSAGCVADLARESGSRSRAPAFRRKTRAIRTPLSEIPRRSAPRRVEGLPESTLSDRIDAHRVPREIS